VDADARAGSLVIVMGRPLALQAADQLCERVRVCVARWGTRILVCDVGALDEPDEVALETLARLRLTARRLDASFTLTDAPRALVDLLAVAGLDDLLPVETRSALEVDRNAEDREKVGVDEVVDAGDAPA
jgi:hypothetical protein